MIESFFLPYAGAVLIGLSLGLTGSGGSILTLPLLVYGFRIAPETATLYSLFIVGSVSAVGATASYRQGRTDIRTALLFGTASLLAAGLVRRFALPRIPQSGTQLGSFSLPLPVLVMLLFAAIMALAATSMIRGARIPAGTPGLPNRLQVLATGLGIGALTGLLGVGGGFLIVPALVLLLHMPAEKAMGTSLLLIAVNALTGFAGGYGQYPVDWPLLASFSAIAIGGIILGGMLGRKLNTGQLRRGFGWFVLGVSACIVAGELFSLFHQKF
ncbi:MAG TPA: sulfite exporter TauE/SafE family protein [Chitinophagaceae bacterium]|jgi:hypothetical protein|nr:sulfite exporter TauE/SafE family protein [Chitinophagaceae bacterium]